MAHMGAGPTQDVEKGFQLRSRSSVSLRPTEKRRPQSPDSLRPRCEAFLNILPRFLSADFLFALGIVAVGETPPEFFTSF